MKGYLLNIRVPAPLFSALGAHVEAKRFAEFARISLAEKLARDFGEKIDVDSLKMRVGQGRRSDLARKRARIAELNAKLAPYGGAAEIIKTGNGAEETRDIINELADARAALIELCPAARKKRDESKKEYEAARAATAELREFVKAINEERNAQAKNREKLKFPESGTPEEIFQWYSRGDNRKPLDLEKFNAQEKKLAELETRRKSHWKNFIELNAEAVRLAEAFAAGKGTGTAKKHARGNPAAK